MSEQRNNRDGQPRHYVALLIGIPLLLFGIWLAACAYPGFYSGRHGHPAGVTFLIIPGAALAVTGGFLIFRAR
ncbi:MAG TPA: hypothetical protein VGM05_18780 [Planctomycetaceae bacterium]